MTTNDGITGRSKMLLLIAICGLFVPYVLAYVLDARKMRKIEAREELGDDEIYQRFYAESGFDKASILELWHEIACILDVPAACMRPADRFCEDIGFDSIEGESAQMMDLVDLACERLIFQGRSEDLDDLKEVRSVDDYVRYFARRN